MSKIQEAKITKLKGRKPKITVNINMPILNARLCNECSAALKLKPRSEYTDGVCMICGQDKYIYKQPMSAVSGWLAKMKYCESASQRVTNSSRPQQ